MILLSVRSIVDDADASRFQYRTLSGRRLLCTPSFSCPESCTSALPFFSFVFVCCLSFVHPLFSASFGPACTSTLAPPAPPTLSLPTPTPAPAEAVDLMRASGTSSASLDKRCSESPVHGLVVVVDLMRAAVLPRLRWTCAWV